MTLRPLQLCLLASLLLAAACSQVTQTAEDCTREQYYDANTEFCLTCPALSLPVDCDATCGFSISSDTRGCQVAVCDCDACPDGTVFDRDRVSCVDCPLVEPEACAAGCPLVATSIDAQGCPQPVCACEDTTGCPPVAQPECGDEGCCTIAPNTDARGCSFPTCECPEEPPAGFYIDEDALCRACPEEGAPEACDP